MSELPGQLAAAPPPSSETRYARSGTGARARSYVARDAKTKFFSPPSTLVLRSFSARLARPVAFSLIKGCRSLIDSIVSVSLYQANHELLSTLATFIVQNGI